MTIYVDEGPGKTKHPRVAGENALVFPGSSLAIVGVWLHAVRDRFSYQGDEYNLPYIWTGELQNPTPETLEEQNASVIKLNIIPDFDPNLDARNYRPAIVVGIGGNITYDSVAVGNFVGREKISGLKAYYCHASTTMAITCLSDTFGESSVLGDIVASYLIGTREIFRETLGFNDISLPVVGKTSPSKKDKEVWETVIQFTINYDVRWGTTPISPKLRGILLTLSTANTNAIEYVTKLVCE